MSNQRCARQDNIWFSQEPIKSSRILPNGEREHYHLNLKCKECEQEALIKPVTAKQAQWWVNIMRMKHDSCHIESIMKRER